MDQIVPPRADTQDVAHEYVPTSHWTGAHDFPRWAACRCGWAGPLRRSWVKAESDYAGHLGGVA